MDVVKIKLLGREHGVTAPDFADAEDAVMAYGETLARGGTPQLRALSAAIGLSTRIGRECDVTYASCKCDPMVYGGKVYGWLREKGATAAQIHEAGVTVVNVIAAKVFPRQPEVDEAAGKSAESEGH